MVGSSRLEIVADIAFTIPEASEISYSFRAIFHKSLYVFLQAFESVIFHDLISSRSAINIDFGGFSALSILNLFSEDFVVL